MEIEDALAWLPQDGTEAGGRGVDLPEGLYAALDRAAAAGLARKNEHRRKYGEIWWSVTPRGRAALAGTAAAS